MLLFTLIFVSCLSIILGYTCLDEAGKPVDNWYAIKGNNGAYYYVYNQPMKTFLLSPYDLTQSTNGAIMQTVGQIYKIMDGDVVNYGSYNDEPPPVGAAASSSSFAHAKGVLMTNATQGFWLVVSMPHFPNQRSVGPGPFPDYTYAQSFACVTVSAADTDVIASNLIIARPFIYDKLSSPSLSASLPNFANLLSGKYVTSPTSGVAKFQSSGGKSFVQLEKSLYYAKDLWDDLVAPYFNSDLDVETWRSGSGGRMGSICGTSIPYGPSGGHKVYEVSSMLMSDGHTWTGTNDHSKWAIGTAQTTPTRTTDTSPLTKPDIDADVRLSVTPTPQNSLVCVGDNNRMCSQEKRGGGAICTLDLDLYNAFQQTIKSFEGCWAYNPCTSNSTQCYWCPV